MDLLESTLGYGMAPQDDLVGTLIADMHGTGVKSWNCVVIVPGLVLLLFTLFPEVSRQAFELRAPHCQRSAILILDPGTT